MGVRPAQALHLHQCVLLQMMQNHWQANAFITFLGVGGKVEGRG